MEMKQIKPISDIGKRFLIKIYEDK